MEDLRGFMCGGMICLGNIVLPRPLFSHIIPYIYEPTYLK